MNHEVPIRTYPTCGNCGHRQDEHENAARTCFHRFGEEGPFCECEEYEPRFRAHTDEELKPLEASK